MRAFREISSTKGRKGKGERRVVVLTRLSHFAGMRGFMYVPVPVLVPVRRDALQWIHIDRGVGTPPQITT